MMRNSLSKLLAAAIIAVAVSITGCSSSETPPFGGRRDTPVPVNVALPSGGAVTGITASGRLESIRSAVVSTRIMGNITHIYVKVGDKVSAGQLLAAIAGQDIEAKKAQTDAQIAAASAALENAQKDFDRYSNLYARQSATASELDNATLRFHNAQASLQAAQQARNEVIASLAYTQLRAPIAGVVTQKSADEGSMASPGMPLLTIEQGGDLQVSAGIAESDIDHVRSGARALVTIPSIGVRAEGVVTQISVSSIQTGGRYMIKISLPAAARKGLYAGMIVNVLIPGTARTDTGGILVPLSALVFNDQLTGIYTVSNSSTAMLRWIRTGRTYGDKIEVLSGLGPDEAFILRAERKLYNGVPVRQQ